MVSAIVEFLDDWTPQLVSAGHDGLCPYEQRPYDEVYVIAYRDSPSLEEQYVEFYLPHDETLTIYNHRDMNPRVRVHRSGFLWHDRVREIAKAPGMNWLSVYGFTIVDPRKMKQPPSELFAILPGSPMKESFIELLASSKWREIRDLHTKDREWMPKQTPNYITYEARRVERDSALVARLKAIRGSECQICGFNFRKRDGTDYCEVHHLEKLADGGLDVSANCVVLCANCHKRFHYGNVRIFSHTAEKLVVSLDGDIYRCDLGGREKHLTI